MHKNWILAGTALLLVSMASARAEEAPEMVIGEEKIEPGIVVIFEGAIKDTVHPSHMHLAEKDTDVHIEARINWDEKDIPKGGVPGGFIPYLKVNAVVENEKTHAIERVELLPHINLIDNFHYARNMKLPGAAEDSYKVTFTVEPPAEGALHYHYDWVEAYEEATLFKPVTYTYEKQDFSTIAKASRR